MTDEVLERYPDGALIWRPRTGAVVRETVDGEGRTAREVIVRLSMCSPVLAQAIAREVPLILKGTP